MAKIEKDIVVNVPVSVAYNQWTQFESFPEFMEGVKEVVQLDEKRLRWRAEIAGKDQEWEAEITDQVPDRHIAWRSVTGAMNAGSVIFQPAADGQTKVALELTYDPDDPIEKVGDALGVLERRVSGDLERFKKFIESRGAETGAWRGEIHGSNVEKGSGTTTR
ncbi:MAG TPA: SRPBCC family protein [Candidatus Limnocylindria bacterium]|nr:SRPBCC family protein [Candidatus Limnocylindria bacterium]